MKNKVDRRDLSQLRNEVDLLSLRLEELGACDPGAIGQMQSRINRIEEMLGETKRILTTAETAAFLGVSKERVYSLAKTGGLPHFRSNRKLFFERNKLTEWIMDRVK